MTVHAIFAQIAYPPPREEIWAGPPRSLRDRLDAVALAIYRETGVLSESVSRHAVPNALKRIIPQTMTGLALLNVNLTTRLPAELPVAHDRCELIRKLTIPNGEMAKALEALDHLEDFPSRPVLERSLLSIFSVCAGTATHRGLKLKTRTKPRPG